MLREITAENSENICSINERNVLSIRVIESARVSFLLDEEDEANMVDDITTIQVCFKAGYTPYIIPALSFGSI